MPQILNVLASVDRITEAGNHVSFGAKSSESFIENVKSRKRIPLRKHRGIYIMDVWFIVNGKRLKGEVIIDSGAAENVMPKDYLPELQMQTPKAGVRFAAANGGSMGNYGRKTLHFIPIEPEVFRRQE